MTKVAQEFITSNEQRAAFFGNFWEHNVDNRTANTGTSTLQITSNKIEYMKVN
jgi:hypothetical protein